MVKTTNESACCKAKINLTVPYHPLLTLCRMPHQFCVISIAALSYYMIYARRLPYYKTKAERKTRRPLFIFCASTCICIYSSCRVVFLYYFLSSFCIRYIIFSVFIPTLSLCDPKVIFYLKLSLVQSLSTTDSYKFLSVRIKANLFVIKTLSSTTMLRLRDTHCILISYFTQI